MATSTLKKVTPENIGAGIVEYFARINVSSNATVTLPNNGAASHVVYILLGFIGTEGATALLIRHFGSQSTVKVVDLLSGTDYAGNLVFSWNDTNKVITVKGTSQPSGFTLIKGQP